MYAIVCTKDNDTTVYYGPFNDLEQVERYAKTHKLGYPNQYYITVKLHNSGDCLDA